MRQVGISLWNIYKIVKILKWQKPTKRYHLQSSQHIGNSDLAQVFSVGGLVQGVTYLLRWVESVFWTLLQNTFFLQWAHSYSHPGQVNISGLNWLSTFSICSRGCLLFGCLMFTLGPVLTFFTIKTNTALVSLTYGVVSHKSWNIFSDVNNWKSLKNPLCQLGAGSVNLVMVPTLLIPTTWFPSHPGLVSVSYFSQGNCMRYISHLVVVSYPTRFVVAALRYISTSREQRNICLAIC